MKKLFAFIIFISWIYSTFGSDTLKPSRSVVYLHAELYTGDGNYYPDGMLGVRDGKIILAGYFDPKIDLKSFDEVIDVRGKFIYPGFIVPNTTLGLREIDAVRATLDFAEAGLINPHVRSQIAYNAESVIIPTLRSNGVLMAQVTPRGGMISGSSTLFELQGINWEDATIKADDGIHINWPAMYRRTGWWAEPGGIEVNKEREKQLRALFNFFGEAKAYAALEYTKEKDLRLEAMKKIFSENASVYFHADYAKELMEVAGFVKEFNIPRAVIVGGQDSWQITELLKENNISVIINRIHELPQKPDDPVDLPFRLPYLLQQAGVLYCLSYEGDMEVMGSRNLPFTAGTATGYGLTKAQAVQAISGNTARILGIDNETGTLNTGRDATFIISTGDALDMRSNNIEQAFIRGIKTDLNNRQQELYRKYKSRYDAGP